MILWWICLAPIQGSVSPHHARHRHGVDEREREGGHHPGADTAHQLDFGVEDYDRLDRKSPAVIARADAEAGLDTEVRDVRWDLRQPQSG